MTLYMMDCFRDRNRTHNALAMNKMTFMIAYGDLLYMPIQTLFPPDPRHRSLKVASS